MHDQSRQSGKFRSGPAWMRQLVFAALLALGASAPAASAPEPAETPASQTGVPTDIVRTADRLDMDVSNAADVALAGDEVSVGGTVGDDLMALGGKVRSRATVSGDTMVAGRDVSLDSAMSGSLFAAGMNVTLTGTVGDDVYAAGRTIKIAPSAVVEGDAKIAGAAVEVEGRIAHNLWIAADKTKLAGAFGGDVTVRGGTVEVDPTGRIDGVLTVNGPMAPKIAAGAVITGGVRHFDVEQRKKAPGTIMDAAGSWLFGTIAATIIGAVLYFAAPAFSASISQNLASRPLPSFGIGLVVGVAAVPLVILLGVTLVGIPFALALLGIFLFAVLAAIPMFALGFAMHMAARRKPGQASERRSTLAWLAGIAAVLALIGVIPVVGGIVLALSAIAAVGAFSWSVWQFTKACRIPLPGPGIPVGTPLAA